MSARDHAPPGAPEQRWRVGFVQTPRHGLRQACPQASLGAAAVLDYTTMDSPPDGATWDLVLDAVGKRRSSPLKEACRRAVAPGGAYVSVDDGTPGFAAADLATLAELVESGAIRAVIDRTYPLERIAEAHRYVEADHKRGNVVVTVAWRAA